MNQPSGHGSATILPFRPRAIRAPASQHGPAEGVLLRPAGWTAEAPFPIVDVDGWYHAEAMIEAKSREH